MRSSRNQNRRDRNRKIGPLKLNKSLEVSYKKLLLYYSRCLAKIVEQEIPSLTDRLKTKLVVNSDSDIIDEVFTIISARISNVFDIISPKVVRIFRKMKDSQQSKLSKAMFDKIGVDITSIFQTEDQLEQFRLAVGQNFDLIEELSSKQLFRIKNIVYQDLRTGTFNAGAIRKQIKEEFGITDRHARFIARDQTHKFYSSLTEISSKQLGLDDYVWHNSRDSRVRGNPSGLYPNAKHNHWTREGKVFSYKKPPAGGNPGQDFGCRCYSEPILPDKYEKMLNGKEIYQKK